MKNRLKKAGLSALKLGMKLTMLSLVALVVVSGLTAFNIMAPQIEEAYVRSTVGTEVVKVSSYRGSGTGFYVKYKNANLIMTNRHVCNISSNSGEMTIQGHYGVSTRKVLFISKQADLCFLEGDGTSHGLEIAKDDFTAGEKTYIVGHPSGQKLTVSYGFFIGKETIRMVEVRPTKVNGKTYNLPVYVPYITSQIHGYSRPGSSGSPITNVVGEVTAVLFAGNRGDNKATFAVPLSEIKIAFIQFSNK